MPAIAPRTCFIVHDDAVYLVTNWEHRAQRNDPAVLIRLSPRHRAIYRTLAAKGRSQQSIYYALFATKGGKRRAKPTLVPIDLADLSPAELASLANTKLKYKVPSLTRLPVGDLRDLVRSLYQGRRGRAG